MKNLFKSITKTGLAFLIAGNLAVVATGSSSLNFATDSASVQQPSPTISAPVTGEVLPVADVKMEKLDEPLYASKEEAKKINKDSTGKYASDEIVVYFKDNLSKENKEGIIKDHKLKIARDRVNVNSKVLKVDPAIRDEILEKLKNDPKIASAKLNGIVQGTGYGGGGGISTGPLPTPAGPPANDPMYPNQWNLQQINAAGAWGWTKGSSSVQVAVLDSGAYHSHPDLNAKVILGYDFVEGDNVPNDENGHGTAVAGALAAVTNNKKDLAAPNWNVMIVAIRVLDENNSGTADRLEDGLASIHAMPNVKVINMSLSVGDDQGVKDQIALHNQYRTVIAGANYWGGYIGPWCDLSYPGNYDNMITVTGTNMNDEETYGCGENKNSSVLLVSAPGDGILGLNRQVAPSVWYGSSFAAPQVSATAAMVWGCLPGNLSNSDKLTKVRESIQNGLDPVDPDGNYGRLSSGRINMKKALDVHCF